jgi:hypothetical protein
VEASEESHVVAEVELRLPMSTTNRLSHLWAKDGSSSRVHLPRQIIFVAKIKKVTKPDEAQHSTTPLKKKKIFLLDRYDFVSNLRSNHLQNIRVRWR